METDFQEIVGSERCDVWDCMFTLWEPDVKARRRVKRDKFPGPDPVPLMRSHLQLLDSTPYLITDKSDGSRVFLMCCQLYGELLVVIIDRRLRVFMVAPMELAGDAYKGTLLDGELTRTREGRTQILLFDAMAAGGTSLMRESDVRVRLCHAAQHVVQRDPSAHLVELRWKHFYDIASLDQFQMHYEAAQKVYHTDGAILTPVNFLVTSGSSTGIFKFKPVSQNTVDFLYKDGNLHVSTSRGKGEKVVAHFQGASPCANGDIIECALVGERWEFVRVRDDKLVANSHDTYVRTLQVIKENLELPDLMHALSAPRL